MLDRSLDPPMRGHEDPAQPSRAHAWRGWLVRRRRRWIRARGGAWGGPSRVGLAGGLYDAASASSNIELVASIAKGVGFVNPDSAFGSGLYQLGHRVHRELCDPGQLPGLSDLRHRGPAQPDATDGGRVPRGPGRPLRLRRPSLYIGTGPGRADRLWNARRRGLDQRRALQRRPHLRHQRHPESADRSRPCRRAAALTRIRSSTIPGTTRTSTSTYRGRLRAYVPREELEGCSRP